MKNIKQAKFVKLFLMFLAIDLLMLFSSLAGKAQTNSGGIDCKLVYECPYEYIYEYVNDPATGQLKYTLNYRPVCKYVTKCVPTATGNDSVNTKPEKTSSKPLIDENAFAVLSDNPFLGTWKYEKYMEFFAPMKTQSIQMAFSDKGIVEITIEDPGSSRTVETNWKYIPTTDKTGVLEQYKGGELVSRGDIQWVNSTQFKYVVAFNRTFSTLDKQITFTLITPPKTSPKGGAQKIK